MKLIFDAQRAVGLNLLGSPKDLGQRALSQSPCLGCFPVAVFFLLIEVIDRHEAAPPLEDQRVAALLALGSALSELYEQTA